MTAITKQTIIGDILDAAPDTAKYFLEIGMHCLGCPHSRGESIEEAWPRLLFRAKMPQQRSDFWPKSCIWMSALPPPPHW